MCSRSIAAASLVAAYLCSSLGFAQEDLAPDAADESLACGTPIWEILGYTDGSEVMKVATDAVHKVLRLDGIKERTVGYTVSVNACAEASATVPVKVLVTFDDSSPGVAREYLAKVPRAGSGLKVEVELIRETRQTAQ